MSCWSSWRIPSVPTGDDPHSRGRLSGGGGQIPVPEAEQFPHRVCAGSDAEEHHLCPQHQEISAAALYNAPATIDSYYASLVNYDLYGKLGPRKTEFCRERRSCGANRLFAFRRKRVIQSQRRRKGDDVLCRKKSSSAPLPSAWRPQSSPPGCCSRP